MFRLLRSAAALTRMLPDFRFELGMSTRGKMRVFPFLFSSFFWGGKANDSLARMIVIIRIGRQTLAHFFLILASLSAVTSLSLAPLYPCAMKGVNRWQSSVPTRRILHGCISSGVQLQAVIFRTRCAEANVYAFDLRERERESRVCDCMLI
jgi:hypothetical protein